MLIIIGAKFFLFLSAGEKFLRAKRALEKKGPRMLASLAYGVNVARPFLGPRFLRTGFF